MTLLTKYDPFAQLNSLNNWVEDEFSRFLPSRLEKAYEHWHPSVDILENEDAFIIKAELPEVAEKDIDMTVEKDLLTLKGERRIEDKTEKENFRRVERYYGNFQRTFRLPESVDTEKVTAKLLEGVLKITLPKKEETKPRTIKVEMK